MHVPNQPKSIIAPSGETARPVLKNVRFGDEIRVEAHYTDPKTGQFITKINVSVTKVDDQ